MSKSTLIKDRDFSEAVSGFGGEPADYRATFETLAKELPFAQWLVVTTFPRGGTQALQPSHAPDGFLRSYSRDAFASDAPTWSAVRRNGPAVADDDCFPGGGLQPHPYYKQLMEPYGLGHVAAVRVSGPVFKGYPGAVHLYRKAGEPAFSHQELETLSQFALQFGRAVERARDKRVDAVCGDGQPWERLGCCRQFIFDGRGHQVMIYPDAAPLDDRLKGAVKQLVTSRIESVNGEAVTSDRVELPDTNGEVWAFRAMVYKTFPALGDGPFVFLCLQPPSCEWDAVKASDFQADPEVSRLIPTLKFMRAEFHRTPTLEEIAAKAHLSPFHFHRRFTELLGQTPKHFLLACQIQHAKRMLMERKVALADIAAECGFAHQSHFTSRFKQATGLTPTRWRRFATERHGNAQEAPAAAEKVPERSPGCAA